MLNLFCKVFEMVFISWLQCFTVRLSGSHLFGNVLVHTVYTWATRFPLHYRKAYLPPWGYISNKVPRSFLVYKRSDIFILAIYQFPFLLISVKEVEDYTLSSQEQKVLLQRVYDVYLTVYSVQSEIGWISLWMWMKRRERSCSSPPAPRCSPALRSSPSWPCWGSSWGSWVSWVSAGSWNSLPGSSCPPTQRPPQHCSLQFTRVQWVRYGTIIILVERLLL